MKASPRQAVVFVLLAALALPAQAITGCSVGTGSQVAFGPVIALASTGDVDSNSGGSLLVRCGTVVALPPSLYSGSTRELSGVGGALPFRLSLSSPGGPDLPASTPGAPLSVASDDVDHVVTLHARLRAADFAALPSGVYTTSVTLTIEY